MNSTIQLEAKSVYGETKFYPVGEMGEAVRALTKKKTVDARDVRALESLGFSVRVLGRAEMPASEVVIY